MDEVPTEWSPVITFVALASCPGYSPLAGYVAFHPLIAVLRRNLAIFSADLFSLGLTENPIWAVPLLNGWEPEGL